MVHPDGWLGTDLVELSDDPHVLERSGRWAVVATFEGELTFARFARWERRPLPDAGQWRGPEPADWTTSMDAQTYPAAVREVRRRIEAGSVDQVNVCRVLAAPLAVGANGAEL